MKLLVLGGTVFLGRHVVDAALARMFGLSRTRSAELIAEGHVLVDGAGVGKSHRVLPGSLLEVSLPAVINPLTVVPEVVEGIKIIHDDDEIVVIDCGRQYLRIPCVPPSRAPTPDSFQPPWGIRSAKTLTNMSLRLTAPASRRRAICSPRARSRVQRLAESP